jgi:hypothetical protein
MVLNGDRVDSYSVDADGLADLESRGTPCHRTRRPYETRPPLFRQFAS